jgi:hydroxyethylthiazole kinase-like sugar kinase family protein
MIAAGEIAAMLERVRQTRPRVHAIMNSVAQKLVADGLSVLGAIPSMTANMEEIADFAAKADALLVNLGTLEGERREVIRTALSSMGRTITYEVTPTPDPSPQGGGEHRGLPAERQIPEISAETAMQASPSPLWGGVRGGGKTASGSHRRQRPAVLDPVFCDVSPTRLAFARELLGAGITTVRGNKSEMAAIGMTEGIVRIETGPVDTIRLGARTIRLANGHPWLALVSGTGCLSGALIAAFQAVAPDELRGATAAIATLSIAAEIAAEKAEGPGSFAPALLDALHAIDEKAISERLRISNEQS